MKKNLILGWLLGLAPVWAGAQVVDTAAVLRQVDSLRQAAIGFYKAGEFEKGLPVIITAAETAKAKLGSNHLKYAEAANTVGGFYFQLGQYGQAESYWLEAKGIRVRVLGKESTAYAQSLNNLASLYFDTGELDKAEQIHLEARDIRAKTLGKAHPDYAQSLLNLSVVYKGRSEYAKAEPLLLEARDIYAKAMGMESLWYARCLTSLGSLYQSIGEVAKAEPFFLKAMEIYAKTVGKENLDYALAVHSLGILCEENGNYAKAEPLYLESLRIKEKILGHEHPKCAASLVCLANLYHEKGDKGDFAKAEQLYLEAKDINEKVFGKEHTDYAICLLNLAAFLEDRGELLKAERFASEAVEIYAKVEGKEHPSYALALQNLGTVRFDRGQYTEAEVLFLETKKILETSAGQGHPQYALTLFNLASNYKGARQYDKAAEYFLASDHSIRDLIQKAARYSSEKEMLAYLQTFEKQTGGFFSFAQDKPGADVAATAYDNTLFQKGFLLNASVQVKNRAHADTASAKKYEALADVNRRLAAEYPKSIAERKSVPELEEKANTLEKDLARTVAGYGDAMRQVTWQEVQAALKPDEATVEFVHYRYYTLKATDSIMYAALVLRPGDTQPQFIPIFEEKELAPLLRGAAGGSNFLKINALYAQKAVGSKLKSLYELIWQPLESLLAGSKTVYCSPSGLLHRINLAAIPASDGNAFGDSRQLVVLGSTRALVVPPVVIPSANAAYLAGGIRYATDSTAIAYANRSASSRSIEQPSVLAFQPDSLSATRGGVLDYLPATAAEVREIGQTLTAAGFRAKVDTGFYATEEVFRQLGVGAPSPRIVHLATHGYFFPDPVSKGQKANSNFGQEPVFKMSEHPMIRSGLIMAGAKQAWLTGKHPVGQEDGILTAYEISQMNLSGTELVVLSACETGLGDIMGNEGVYGLQRAFKIAGAKYLIMSLWKVDDRSTQEFMTAFYRHWLTDKQPVPQAFRAAQREVRAKHPGAYDWAGFVLVE